MTTFTVFAIFAALMIGALTRMVKIQRDEYFAARAKQAKKKASMDAFRAKCYRPDGD